MLHGLDSHAEKTVLEYLTNLSDQEFVNLMVRHLDFRADFLDVVEGPPGPDAGVDIVAKRRVVGGGLVDVAVQCKCYAKQPSVSRSAAASFLDGMRRKGIRHGLLIATVTPSDSARDSCESAKTDGYYVEWRDWTGHGLVHTLLLHTPSLLLNIPALTEIIPLPFVVAQYCPSFEVVEPVSPVGTGYADRFYNGFPPTWIDLELGFDIQRIQYTKEDGLKKTAMSALAEGRRLTYAVLGVSGTGKTTLLRRLAYDAAKADHLALRLRDDWIAVKSPIAKQVETVLEKTQRSVLVIIDNASDLHFKAGVLEGTLLELKPDWPVVVLLADQPDRWQYMSREVPYARGVPESKILRLHQLMQTECEALVDRILRYEEDETLRERTCSLSRAQRLQLCIEDADRQFLVAMLQLRHGMRFKELIKNELARIPTERARETYSTVCLFNNYGLSIPEPLVLKAFGADTALSIQSLKDATTGLLISDWLGLRARHPRIARIVARHAIRNRLAVKAALLRVLAQLDVESESNRRFFDLFFTCRGLYRRVVNDLDRDAPLVHNLCSALDKSFSGYPPVLRRLSLTFHAMAERLLGEVAEARRLFQEATALDPPYAFAYRQKAWLEHSEGNWEIAADDAIEAARVAPHDYLCLLHCARILSLNTVQNFRKARSYLEKALEIAHPDVAEKTLEQFEAAERVLGVLEGLNERGVVPGVVLRELRPGLSFLRALHGGESKRTKDALKRRLRAMEEDTTGTVADLESTLQGIEWKHNKVLQACVACNTARLLYLDWYNNEIEHDLNGIEALFQESLRLNPRDPFTYCWYGTFLKEVRKDFSAAYTNYQHAIRTGNRMRSDRFHCHPLFLNNMGLLKIDELRAGLRDPRALLGVYFLLKKAVRRVEELSSDFFWPYQTLSLCRQLLLEHRMLQLIPDATEPPESER